MANSYNQEVSVATGLTGTSGQSRLVGTVSGAAPTTGTFAVGDFVVDQTGAIYVCTVAGTPGTWVLTKASNITGTVAIANGGTGATNAVASLINLGALASTQYVAGKNFIINGGMDIWQRGTTGFTTNSAYTADRWGAGLNSGTFAVSQSTDVPTGFTYSLSLVGTTALNAQIFTRIESANSTPFAGKTVTLSLWAKSTAGTSQLGYSNGYANSVNNFASQTGDTNGTFTSGAPSGSWTKYSATFTANALAANGYQIIIYRAGTDTSTTLITGVQLEIGSTATTFSRAGGTIQGELAACQRYLPAVTLSSGNSTVVGMANLTTRSYYWLNFGTTSRVAPTGITISALSGFNVFNGSVSNGTPTAVTYDSGSLYGSLIYVDTTAGSPTIATGQATLFRVTSTGSILFTGCEL